MSESYPGFEVCWYGHIGDGNLHLNILRPEHMKVDEFMRHGHDMSPKYLRSYLNYLAAFLLSMALVY